MSDEFSIDRNRSKRPADAGDDLYLASTDPGPAEWDLDEAAPEREAPQAAPATAPAAALPPPFRDLPEDEDEKSANLPNLDIRRSPLGCWRRRNLVGGIAAAFILTFGILAFTMIDNQWTAVATLIKRDTSDEFAVGGGKPFKPQQYNLQTLLDTLKLPSSLDEVIARAGLDIKRTACPRPSMSSSARNPRSCTS